MQLRKAIINEEKLSIIPYPADGSTSTIIHDSLVKDSLLKSLWKLLSKGYIIDANGQDKVFLT